MKKALLSILVIILIISPVSICNVLAHEDDAFALIYLKYVPNSEDLNKGYSYRFYYDEIIGEIELSPSGYAYDGMPLYETQITEITGRKADIIQYRAYDKNNNLIRTLSYTENNKLISLNNVIADSRYGKFVKPDEYAQLVKPFVPADTVNVSQKTATLYVGKSVFLQGDIGPSNATNKGVKWSSSNSKVAKVNQKGKVTGVKKGTATITATALDGSGVKASCKITVKQPVNKITLNIKSKTIRVGKKIMATAKPGTANDKSIKWTVSNKKVATLAKAKTASGKYNTITAKKAGKVTVTAKPAQGGKISVSCKITVK